MDEGEHTEGRKYEVEHCESFCRLQHRPFIILSSLHNGFVNAGQMALCQQQTLSTDICSSCTISTSASSQFLSPTHGGTLNRHLCTVEPLLSRCAGSDSILLETWMAMFGERRGLAIGRSWATRIFAIAFAFFSVIVMAACACIAACPMQNIHTS